MSRKMKDKEVEAFASGDGYFELGWAGSNWELEPS